MVFDQPGNMLFNAFLFKQALGQAQQNSIYLVANGYPNHIITSTFFKNIRQFNQSSQHESKKCPVYLHLPWLGNISTKFKKQITTAIQRCYFAVETCVVSTTRTLLPATKKHVLPAHDHNNVIYPFVCTEIVGS